MAYADCLWRRRFENSHFKVLKLTEKLDSGQEFDEDTHAKMTRASWKHRGLRYISAVAVLILISILSFMNADRFYFEDSNTYVIPPVKHAGTVVMQKTNVSDNERSFIPERRLHLLCKNVKTSPKSKLTSTMYSRLQITKLDSDGSIVVSIHTFDMTNTSKTVGGDVIVIWANQTDGKGLVSGQVIDHRNGSYTGILKVFWTGLTKVYGKLASSLENTCLRVNALIKYGNLVFAMQKPWGIRGLYRKNLIQANTMCGASPRIAWNSNFCNFTSLNGGMSWYCGKPTDPKLQCSDIFSFNTGTFYNSMVPQSERIQVPGHGIFKDIISIEIQRGNEAAKTRNQISCSRRSPLLSWTEPMPSGFWLNDKWNFVNCYSAMEHNTTKYAQCLRNKNVVIIGDSTLRQYAEYFVQHVLNLGRVHINDAVGARRMYHTNKVFTNSGINLMYIKHEMPFHNPDFPVNGIMSVPQILHSMEDNNFEDNSLIVVINYNSHFSAYPPSSFRERIRLLVVAIERFLEKKPRAKVLFKGPHLCIDDTRWFDTRISLLFDEIIKEEFRKLMNKVIYLDIWSITVSHNSELLHPIGDAFVSHINQLMAYVC